LELPDEFPTKARREPVESVTTDAVTPILLELIVLARSFSVLTVPPVAKVFVDPLLATICSFIELREAAELATAGEYHEAEDARLFTVTV